MITYSEYAPTNIVWDKTMPSHWKCDKAKRFFSNPKELNKGNLEKNVLSLTLRGVIRNNVDNPIGLSPADYSTYQIFEANELVFKLIDLENISTSRVGIVNERGIMSSAYIRLKPITDMNLKYFYYQYYDWYKRNIFNGLGGGVRQTLSAPDLMELSVMYPPKDEQDQIVRFKDLEYDDKVEFKKSAKSFVRTYNFLSSILPYGSPDWEKLSIFLTLLVPKLPKVGGENDDYKKIIESVDLDSYRVVAQQTMSISLANEDAEVKPVPVQTDIGIPVPELDTLTHILESFHDVWGNCDWTDEDKIKKQIQEIAEEVKKDERYQNAMQFSDIQNARDESERATWEAILRNMSSGMELYTAYQGDTRSRRNQSFRDWLLDLIFNATYQKPTTPKPDAKKVYSFDYEPPVSMVAEDSTPYGAKKEG